MTILRSFALGMFAALVLIGCVGAQYRFYTLDVPGWNGTLKAHNPKDDLTLKTCEPTDADKAPCFVLMSDEYYKILRDLRDTQERLKACESGHAVNR